MIECFGLATGELGSVSLRFSDGESAALIGPKDEGPLSLVRVLSGTERPISGNIRIERRGTAIKGRALRRNLSRAFAQAVFPPRLHVWDVLMLTAFAYGMNRKKAEYRAEQALCAFGLEKAAAILPALLPEDWQRRVALAQAMVPDAGIVALEEAYQGLGAEAAGVEDIVRQLSPDATVLWLFQDPKDAERLNRRNVLMSSGTVLFDGTCAEAVGRCACADFGAACDQMRKKGRL